MLPKIKYADSGREMIQESFTGGLNRTEYIKSGEIFDTGNMSSEAYPVLKPRKKRKSIIEAPGKVIGLGAGNKLYYAAMDGEGYADFYYDGEKIEGFKLTNDEKTFVNLGDYIIIYPDMKYYFTGEVKGTYVSTSDTDALKLLDEANLTADISDGDYFQADEEIYMHNSDGEWITGTSNDAALKRVALTRNVNSRWVFMGKRYGKMSEKHAKSGISLDDVFALDTSSEENGLRIAVAMRSITDIKAGDSVRIFVVDENGKNKYETFTKINEIYYDSYKDIESDIFVVPHDEELKNIISTATSFSMEREIPELDGMFECNMRLWGYKGDSIYASGLGSPFTWSSYSNDLEAWSIDTETAGDITAGCNYNGYPVFFKEDYIFKITGGLPSDFSLSITPVPGQGCIAPDSLLSFGGSLIYLSPKGFVDYSGVFPMIISESLNEEFSSAVSGYNGKIYYTTARSEDGDVTVYTFAPSFGIWLREDDTDFTRYVFFENTLFASFENEIFALDECIMPGKEEEIVSSYTEFCPINEVYLDKKVLKNISVRLKTDKGASVKIFKKENGTWILKKTVGENFSGTVFLRCAPHRGDSYSLKIEGTGEYVIYAAAREYARRSKKG